MFSEEIRRPIAYSALLQRALVVSAVALVLVFSVSGLHLSADVEVGMSLNAFTAQLDRYIPSLMRLYDIPGLSIALVRGGEVSWSEAYGYADLAAGREMTTDTYLRVQSISKPITAWGVMRLVEQGEIELDVPVQEYIKSWRFPESRFSTEKITVRQLLSHTAGLPLGDIFNLYFPERDQEIPSLQECLSAEARPVQEPGSTFFYSNTGYNLLELLIEEVTGRDFAEYMQSDILGPLGMHNSTFVWSAELDPPVPFGYDLAGEAIPVYVYPEKGSGGLFATVEDIAVFVAAGMPGFSGVNAVLSDRSINALYTPVADRLGVYSLVFDSYGLGHYLEILPNGKLAVSHGGQGTGWMTHFHSVPETGEGIVILTNSQRSWPAIAQILTAWARWSGFSSVGMGRIVWGSNLLWVLVGLLWASWLWLAWGLAAGVLKKARRFLPLAAESQLRRLAQGGVSAALLAGLYWCSQQDYLLISSLFPLVSDWLQISVLIFSVVLLLTALCPAQASAS